MHAYTVGCMRAYSSPIGVYMHAAISVSLFFLGVSLLAYGALAGGLLTGKYLEWLEYPTAGRLLRFPSYMRRLR